jgi:hypothetical protein
MRNDHLVYDLTRAIADYERKAEEVEAANHDMITKAGVYPRLADFVTPADLRLLLDEVRVHRPYHRGMGVGTKDAPREHWGINPRAIGLNFNPCFVCGGGDPSKARADFAAFVKCREDGLEICNLFLEQNLHGPKLDYRPKEPSWIQVKFCTCPDHVPLLRAMHVALCEELAISAELIRWVLGLDVRS